MLHIYVCIYVYDDMKKSLTTTAAIALKKKIL